MTLSATGACAVYAGSGSAGPFSLVDSGANPILFVSNSEIVVTRYTNPDDSHPTLLAITTDYTLTGAGLSTPGAVTLTSVLAAGQTLVIRRITPLTQSLDLVYGGALSLENLEATLDRMTRIMQEVRFTAERALVFSATQASLAGSELRVVPAPTAGAALRWNSAGDRLENVLGRIIYSGSGVPSSSLGTDGDFYIDFTNDLIYGPKTAGLWGSSTSLVGVPGPQGPQGIQGIQGPPGASGSGSGDVVSSGAVLDNQIVLYDGASGDVIKTSGSTFAALNATIAGKYAPGGTDVALADGGTGASLVDPNADRIMFWDDSAGAVAFLAASTGLNITGTNMTLSHLGIQNLVDPNADRIMFWDDSSGFVDWLVPANGIQITTTNVELTTNQRLVNIPFIIDGGGATITTGIKGDIVVPFACTITGWTLLADQSGSIVIDIWKDTYANYPPLVADTITAADKPTISAAVKGQDLAPTGWTTAVAAGDTLRFNVDSITTLQRVTLNLLATKT